MLTPEHVADLRRSGLNDETIAAVGFRSLAAHEVRGILDYPTAGTGMAIPYPGCIFSDGQPYLRVRLDHPLQSNNGHSIRYLTRRGERNRLYLPPNLPKDAASNPAVSLTITEGEKKGLAACQAGIPCIALSGVWSWRTRFDGRSFPLPDLCNIHWWGRQVHIVFDSDLVQNESVRAAEESLARELISRGAKVRRLRLPSRSNGEKVGLDDFLLTHTKEEFANLPVAEPLATSQAGRTIEYVRFATEEPGPIRWIVEPLFPQETINILSGDSGAGKSWLALELSQAVASGRPWLGHFPVTQGPVLYFDEESVESLLHQRIWQLRQCDPELPSDLPIRFRLDTGLLVDQSDGIALLRADLEELAPALLVIDSFRGCYSGDENDSAQVRVAFRNLKHLATEFGCAILVLHHTRKLSQVSNSASQMLRGSTDLRGAIDTHLFLRARQPGSLLIEHEKSRWVPSIETFGVEFVAGEEGGLSICYVAEADPEGDKLEEAKFAILGWLGEGSGPVDRPTILARAKAQGISRRTTERALGELEDSKQISRAGKRGHRVLYQRTGNVDLALL